MPVVSVELQSGGIREGGERYTTLVNVSATDYESAAIAEARWRASILGFPAPLDVVAVRVVSALAPTTMPTRAPRARR